MQDLILAWNTQYDIKMKWQTLTTTYSPLNPSPRSLEEHLYMDYTKWGEEGGGWRGSPIWTEYNRYTSVKGKDFQRHWSGIQFNRFTPKSDQFQISPAISPEIVHHRVQWFGVFIAYCTQVEDGYTVPRILTTSCVHFPFRKMCFLNLGVKRLDFWPRIWVSSTEKLPDSCTF